MKRPVTYLILLAVLLSATGIIHAQDPIKVQVVTKSISKKIDWSPGKSVMLTGDNAEIQCTSHPEKTIDIDITIISRNENRTAVESDLSKMKLLVEDKENQCFIRNYIELGRNDSKPSSSLKVIFRINVPDSCPLVIRNSFGKTEIASISGDLNVYSEFSPVFLDDIRGKAAITTLFGDIYARRLQGNTDISATRSEINLKISDPRSLAFQFDLSDTDLNIPENLILQYDKNANGKIKASFNINTKNPVISLNLTNCDLVIE